MRPHEVPFTALPLLLAAALTGASPLAQAADTQLKDLPGVGDLPRGTVQISPYIPGMGEHWADPKTLPLGPVYCVMDGHVVCVEFMIAQRDFQNGKSFERLRLGLDGKQPPIDHMEFDFMPHGHEGFEVPHYDVHMYFVPPEVRFGSQQAHR
jgi:hypothetical protein